MKIFFCRVLIVSFLLNLLLADVVAAAPATHKKATHPQKESAALVINENNIGYLPYADMQEVLLDQSLGKKKPAKGSDADLRLFLFSASEIDFLNFIATEPLPQTDWSIGINQHVPGVHITQNSEPAERIILERLSSMNPEEVSYMLMDLAFSPTLSVASWATQKMYQAYSAELELSKQNHKSGTKKASSDVETKEIYPLLSHLQKKLLNAINQMARSNNTHTVGAASNKNKEYYRTADFIQLRGYRYLLAVTLQKYLKANRYPVLLSQASLQSIRNQMIRHLTMERSLYEKVEEESPLTLLRVEFAAMTLLELDGVNGFLAAMNALERQNLTTRAQTSKNQLFDIRFISVPSKDISLDNAERMKKVFSALMAFYPQAPKGLSAQEKTEFKKAFIHYANHGSGAARLLSLSTLSQWHQLSGNPERLFSGTFLTPTQQNQVADLLKTKFYCPLVKDIRKSVLGASGEERAKAATVAARAYNALRIDNPSFITPQGSTKPLPCTVSTQRIIRINGIAQAKDWTNESMWFIAGWVGIGMVFRGIGLAAKGTSYLARAAAYGIKTAPKGRKIAATTQILKSSLASASQAKTLAKEGVEVSKVVLNKKGQEVMVNMAKRQIPSSSENVLGYVTRTRLPGGVAEIKTFAPQVTQKETLRLIGTGKTINSPFGRFFQIADEAATALPKGPQAQAAREAIAIENFFATGLENISAQNLAAGINPHMVNLGTKLAATPLGFPATGTVRADLLPYLVQPGAVTSYAIKDALMFPAQYIASIGTMMTGFAVADLTLYSLAKLPEYAMYENDLKKMQNMLGIAESNTQIPGVLDLIFDPEVQNRAMGFTFSFPYTLGKGLSLLPQRLLSPEVTNKAYVEYLQKNNPYWKKFTSAMPSYLAQPELTEEERASSSAEEDYYDGIVQTQDLGTYPYQATPETTVEESAGILSDEDSEEILQLLEESSKK